MRNSTPSMKAAAHDDKLFGEQLVAILPMLRRFARSLCRQQAMAEDLAQEAVMRGWAARASFVPGTNLRAWVCVILRNRFYTVLRRERRNASWDPAVAERVLVCPAYQESGIMVADVARAMQRLPAAQREMLMLVGASALSYEEAAQAAGCALGTVKSRLARGRQALVNLIDGPETPAMISRLPAAEYA